ncbi:beta transducin-like protein HET-E2c [Colletotrichum tofieldiae]|uniref:Mitochondrial division protein 1 n=1 Tax=Colletotrichum tofieldiae TaxID=708197 RepID=A0A161VPH5_9PEZI|nr:beta transducin-like protein HET-E2c [Colletotrichum tofieldiae]
MEDNRTVSGSTFGDGTRLHQGDNYYYGPPEPGERYLAELYITDPRRDKKRIEDTKGGLLADCYRWILENHSFLQWHNDPHSRLLWIKGDPGKGKTMLLCGIIDELDKTSSKPIYFFCQAADQRLNSATAVLRGLIWFLVLQQPTLIMYLQAEYSQAGKRLFEDANAWYALSQMLISMLADPLLDDQILVIDALDECVTDLRRLLDFMSKSASSRAKWIVSSRNWPTIEQNLESTSQLCLELNEDAVSTAVRAYIQHKVDQLASKNKYDGSTIGLVQSYLISNANDTFLWVALVCHQLTDVRSRHVPSKMISFPPGLDALYDRMMAYIFQSDDAVLCRQILAATSVVYRPVSLKELIALIPSLEKYEDDLDTIEEIVSACGSFLTLRAGVINFVHKSAKDFLLERASEKILPFGIVQEHESIFDLGLSVDQISPPPRDPLAPARYSCIYWVDHFHAAKLSVRNNLNDETDAEVIYEFLYKKFIYWLEALAIMRSLSEGVMATRTLEEWAEKYQGSHRLLDFVQDAHRFILSHKTAIETAPLQVYASALVFSPTRSLVREAFKREIPKWIIMQPIVPTNWDACLSTLEGHDEMVDSVIFTASGQRIASASRDRSMKIWDVATGACLLTLEGHRLVDSVVFIANDQQLASASRDGSVNIWDLATGSCLLTFDGYGDTAWVTAFTQDGGRLALGYENGAIKLRDIAGAVAVLLIEGHNDAVWSAAFTTDGQRLASGSRDKAVKIWDTVSGACVLTLKGHSATVRSVAFSADGQQLASGSDDMTIKLWDPVSGACVSTLHYGVCVASITFTSDRRWLASGSIDGSIKLWDLTTFACVSILEGHRYNVTSVAFTENGQRLTSGSYDSTIKIWDLVTGARISTFESHGSSVESVMFTADGQRLASVSVDGIVKIWNPDTGACVSTFKAHHRRLISVQLTADSQRLASWSGDGVIKIWDMAMGACVSTLECHGNMPVLVTFAETGQQLATGHQDGTIRAWDLDTGECVSMSEGHSGMVWDVKFTADSQRLVSVYRNKTVRLWDLATNKCLLTLKHRHMVMGAAYTASGHQLVLETLEGFLEIWDLATGACVSTLGTLDDDMATSFAFSADSQRLAIGYWSGSIGVWNTATGAWVGTEHYGPRVKSIAFIDDKHVMTNIGMFVLDSKLGSNASLRTTPQDGISLVGYGISKDSNYVMKGRKRVLWLPAEYRSTKIAVFGETVAIGCKSGRVVFIKFSAEDVEL